MIRAHITNFFASRFYVVARHARTVTRYWMKEATHKIFAIVRSLRAAGRESLLASGRGKRGLTGLTSRELIAVALLSLAVVQDIQALSVTVGVADPSNGNNCLPFGCSAPRYQQVYASSSFSSAMTIERLTFFDGLSSAGVLASGISPGTYIVKLSTTAKAVGALSSTMDDNLGANTQVFFDGALDASTAGGQVSISGNPFLYNPASGNLLLEVTSTSALDPRFMRFLGFEDSALSGRPVLMSRLFGSGIGAQSDGRNAGLVTQFSGPAAVPLPAALWLFAPALGVLGMSRKRAA